MGFGVGQFWEKEGAVPDYLFMDFFVLSPGVPCVLKENLFKKSFHPLFIKFHRLFCVGKFKIPVILMRNLLLFRTFLVFLFVVGGAKSSFGQELDWKWQNPLPTGNFISDVQFLGDQTGWAVGLGTILKTSNGGQSWLNQNKVTGAWLISVCFTDSQIGWIVGDSGIILKTSNSGRNWISQISGTVNELSSVHFTNPQTGFAVGEGGTILKTSNGGVLSETKNLLNTFSLHR